MAFTNIGSSASSGVLERAWFYTSSYTWMCQENGLYQICVAGAGGSGGVVIHKNQLYLPLAATGGGGSGYTQLDKYITKNTTLDITIGAGGVGVGYTHDEYDSWPSIATNQKAGVAGGTTSVINTNIGVNLVVTGGGGGNTTNMSMSVVTPSAFGGVGSGGDINHTGGNSGTARTNLDAQFLSGVATGGGGAANFYGNGLDSNNIEDAPALGVRYTLAKSWAYNYNPGSNADYSPLPWYYPFKSIIGTTFFNDSINFGASHGVVYANDTASIIAANRQSTKVDFFGGSGGVCFNANEGSSISIVSSGKGGNGLVTIQKIG